MKPKPDIFEGHATPFYAYSIGLLRQTLFAARDAAKGLASIHYAIKANPNPEILKIISQAGFGADCVSIGEILLAVEKGFEPAKIVFAGVGKTDVEIAEALEIGIGCFNVESAEELEVIAGIAAGKGVKAPVALRVNPDVDAHTHANITTGLSENKFGINLDRLDSVVEMALSSESISFKGLHFHIGSQITDMQPFAELCGVVNSLLDDFRVRGIDVEYVNMGGGLGVDYENPLMNPIPDFKAYFDTFRNNLRLTSEQHLHFELGRALVAQCGMLISRCLYVKHGSAKDFVILDAGMTELIRPALYGARHAIVNLSAQGREGTEKYDVVGPVCESSDVFAKDEILPPTRRGDLFAILSAGAYGEAMSSNYNCRQLNNPIFFDEDTSC